MLSPKSNFAIMTPKINPGPRLKEIEKKGTPKPKNKAAKDSKESIFDPEKLNQVMLILKNRAIIKQN